MYPALPLAPTEHLLLSRIAQAPSYGQQLAKLVPRGSVYVLLGRLAAKGYVTSEQRARVTGPPVRLYTVTREGQRALDLVAEVKKVIDGTRTR